jgi:nucleoside-diphosphate-sugar epimerase
MPSRTSFCHIREVARAHLLAYEKGRCGENYLLGGPNASQLELLQVFARTVGCPEPTRTMPPALVVAVGAVMEAVSAVTGKPPLLTRKFVSTMNHCWFVDSTRACTELGYAPPSLEERCADIADWMRSEGRLP